MQAQSTFLLDSPVADRQPKTDRLILPSYLRQFAADLRLDRAPQVEAHKVLLKWAELETSGRLARQKETRMQGDFLAQVFGDALGYSGPLDGQPTWHRQQHHTIAGQEPDAILGRFTPETPHEPLAVVELKGPKVHLDRDRSNGRTAVDQCWDYLVNTPPTCRWGIVSNFVSFRLYERDSTKRVYEHFSLQSLREFETFQQFYFLFHRQGLIEGSPLYAQPRALELLRRTLDRQRTVGDELYESYSSNRTNLIAHLHYERKYPIEAAIEMAQRLFDRIMFIAFCEDRQLLPSRTIAKAYTVAGFHAVTNPRWQNFKNLFRFIDQGNSDHDIPRYNGGLFATHAVDEIELPDKPWAAFFHSISQYDFADEVNLDVLGHLFERSITELEKLKQSGLFGGDLERVQRYATMPQSARRKELGIYYTPAQLTSRIVQYTVEELIAERFAAAAVEYGVKAADAKRGVMPDGAVFWRRCLEILRGLRIVDPACGSGAFLFQAYSVLEQRYHEVIGHLEKAGDPEALALAEAVPACILQDNLYGVDLSPEAVEITQLALWIRSAAPGHTLASLSANIVHGNSLVHDPAVDARGFDWKARFPRVFDRPDGGFDCVIGNPPWERIKLQEREFFSLPAPEIATATNAAKRRVLVGRLEAEDPELFARYRTAQDEAETLLTYCRTSEQYPLTGRGDINTYAVFAELAYRLVSPHGRVGLLVPSGIATDNTTKDFFGAIAESNRLIRLYDFENKKTFFPEVHASFKFCILNFSGDKGRSKAADFVFFAHGVEDLENRARHIALSGEDIRLLNPNTRTCPIFRTRRDSEITKGIYRRVPILIDRNRTGPIGNPWGVQFKRMFDQTNDAELFQDAETLRGRKFRLEGNRWVKGRETYLPVYEAKMFRPYDHRFGSVFEDTSNWINQGQTNETTLVQHQNPEFQVLPRWWAQEEQIVKALSDPPRAAVLTFRDITRSSDARTFIATMLPAVGLTNTAPLILTTGVTPRAELCLLANTNSLAFDFISKQKVGHIHMNFFIVEQLPVFAPDNYAKTCPWQRTRKLETWISERVLKLTCTAVDMLPLAEACGFKGGSFKAEYGGRLNRWDEAERAELMAELDAAYFHLYGLDADEVEYVLSTFSGIDEPSAHHPNHVSTKSRVLGKYADYAAMAGA